MSETAPSPTLPTGAITFLLTDLEGSTRLWEQAPDAMRHAMARHDALVEAAVATGGGVVVRPRGEGDSRFAVFPVALNAVSSAAAMQRALYAEPWQTPSPLRIRIGLYTGEADVREGDYYGSAVNRCSRLRGAAHGGQTLVSQTTHAPVGDSLPQEIRLADLGEYRLKDVRQPERIYQLVVSGLPSEFPPLRSLETLHTNLPSLLTSFIGREREMNEVKQALKQARLLTIAGPGGAGKTRLALRVGADLLDSYRDGVWFVELAPVSDPQLLVPVVASTLGAREEPGEPILETLLEYLRDRDLLLILDNCEHLVTAAAEFADRVLRTSSALRILATTREPLHIDGERVWPIPSLSLPQLEEKLSAEQVGAYEAVRLFVDRAAGVRPDFHLTPENAEAVEQICRRLDGIPLAIELAAARVKALSVQEIAARLDDRFGLLVGGSRTALPRQRTLRALIDWSHDLLSEQEHALFRRLAVFAGGFTLEAAEFVCADRAETEERRLSATSTRPAEVSSPDVLDLLSALIDKSLVTVDTGDPLQRYGMLETIRGYALDRLVASGEQDAYAQRHAEYFARFAKRSYAQLWGPKQSYWLPRLEADHDNLRTALEWAERDPARAETLLFMTATLWRFWEMHGHLSEGRAWLEKALARTDDAASLTPRQKWYRANALRGAGNLVRLQGDYDQATALHAAAFTLFREVDDPFGIARELDVLGEIARYQGEYTRAIPLHTASLEMRRQIRDKEGIAASLANLGIVARDQGDNEQAARLLEQSLPAAREVGDKRQIALVLNNLGMIANVECDYDHATALYEESLALYRELDDPLGISFALQNLGNVALDRGALQRAADLYEECLGLKRQLGDKRGGARAVAGLAEVSFFRGEYARAKERGEQSLAVFEQLAVKRDVLQVKNILAFVHHFRGEQEQAAAAAQTSLALARELGTRRGEGFGHEVLGLIAYSHGDQAEAAEELELSLDIFKQVRDRRNVAFVLVNLGRVRLWRGEPGPSRRVLEESLRFSREVGNQWGIAFALEILALVERKEGRFPEAREAFRQSLSLSVTQGNRQGIVNCLGGLAGLEATAGDLPRAARLFAAADRQRDEIGSPLSDPDRAEYEEHYTRLNSKLNPAVLKANWDVGCAFTLEQAVQEARQA